MGAFTSHRLNCSLSLQHRLSEDAEVHSVNAIPSPPHGRVCRDGVFVSGESHALDETHTRLQNLQKDLYKCWNTFHINSDAQDHPNPHHDEYTAFMNDLQRDGILNEVKERLAAPLANLVEKKYHDDDMQGDAEQVWA